VELYHKKLRPICKRTGLPVTIDQLEGRSTGTPGPEKRKVGTGPDRIRALLVENPYLDRGGAWSFLKAAAYMILGMAILFVLSVLSIRSCD
jgi:hypothetical protein